MKAYNLLNFDVMVQMMIFNDLLTTSLKFMAKAITKLLLLLLQMLQVKNRLHPMNVTSEAIIP